MRARVAPARATAPQRRSHSTDPALTRHARCSRSRSGLAPDIPEDLYCLIKKAVAIRKHLDRNRPDKDSKFRLILIESKIHRITRYYRKTRQLAPNWKYESATASTLVA